MEKAKYQIGAQNKAGDNPALNLVYQMDADDVPDVVYLIDYVFAGMAAPCNPCACSPYPTNCP